MSDARETRAVDAALAERLAGPALPFVDEGAKVDCRALPAPFGAAAVPIVVEAVPWRHGSALRLTVIVKATFSLVAPVLAPAPAAAPFLRADAHHGNQPLAHVTAAADRVPWKTAVDVTLIGHAHAPGGAAVPEMSVRFALASSERALIDKSARVLGHRIAAGAAPKPFTTMPIVYERAHGGASTPANPVGCGEGGRPPNVIDPVSAWRPAGFGPIAAAWPLRHKRLGDIPRGDLDARIVVLPAAVDWGYFQSAPPDQILWELPAEATMLLEGLLPDAPRFETRLPGARAVGAIYGREDTAPEAPTELAFHADTMHVDADQRLVTITFRACVDLRDEAALERVQIAAGVGLGGRVPEIPARRLGDERPLAPVAPAAPAARVGSGTMVVLGEPASSRLPFGSTHEGKPRTGSLQDLLQSMGERPAAAEPPAKEPVAPVATSAAAPVVSFTPAPAPPVKEPVAATVAAPKASPWAPAPEAPAPTPAPSRPSRPLRPAMPGPSINVLSKLYGAGTKR